jgi:hypothetical protein
MKNGSNNGHILHLKKLKNKTQSLGETANNSLNNSPYYGNNNSINIPSFKMSITSNLLKMKKKKQELQEKMKSYNINNINYFKTLNKDIENVYTQPDEKDREIESITNNFSKCTKYSELYTQRQSKIVHKPGQTLITLDTNRHDHAECISSQLLSNSNSQKIIINDINCEHSPAIPEFPVNKNSQISISAEKEILMKVDLSTIKDQLVDKEFQEFMSQSQKVGSKKISKTRLFKKVDIDYSLGGRFTDKFTNKLTLKTNLTKSTDKSKDDTIKKDIYNTIINQDDSALEEFMKLNNKETINCSQQSLNYGSEMKSVSPRANLILPLISSKELFMESRNHDLGSYNPKVSLDKNEYSNYNHSTHLRQKFINHKKLFKNQGEIKKLYSMVKTIQNNVSNLVLTGQTKDTLIQKEKIRQGVVKMMEFRHKEVDALKDLNEMNHKFFKIEKSM